jgi:hypothetical protein
VDWAIYGALIAGSFAVAAAAGLLAVRVLEGWRSLKRLRRGLAEELQRLAALAEETSRAAERAADQSTMTASVARLRVTLARFAVLRSALDETTAAVGRITAVVPRK